MLQAGACVSVSRCARSSAGRRRAQLLELALASTTCSTAIFSFYTRKPDGVVAEYADNHQYGCRQSQRDSAADDSPSGEHDRKRGMLAFVPGYLYMGPVGDGGIGQQSTEQRAGYVNVLLQVYG